MNGHPQRRVRRAVLVALASLPLGFSGCGSGVVAVASAVGGSSSSSSGRPSGGSQPRVAALTIEPTPFQSGLVPLRFDLVDARSRPLGLRVRYSLDGGASFPFTPTFGPGSAGLETLASSPEGRHHVLVWDSENDLTVARVPRVRFRLTPLLDGNPIGAGARETPTFPVDNSIPPVMGWVSATSDPQGPALHGRVALEIELEDEEGDPVDLELSMSTDGGATYRLLDGVASSVHGLATGPPGSPRTHVLAWNSAVDVPTTETVLLRAVPRDVKEGAEELFGPVEVNNTAPSVRIDGISPPAPFDVVAIEYTLVDASSDPIDVEVFYSLDGSAPSRRATRALGRGGEGETGLASDPSGVAHVFLWDAVLDLGPSAVQNDVRVAILARDTSTGVSVLSSTAGPFAYDGRRVATVAGAIPAGRIVPGVCARDRDGSIVFVDRSTPAGVRLRRYDPAIGALVDLAGGGSDPGENVPALMARIDPLDVAIGPLGDVFFAEADRIRRVDLALQVVRTYAGGGTDPGEGVDRLQALLAPRGLAIDTNGVVFLSDVAVSPRVRRIAPATGRVDTLVLRGPMGATVTLTSGGDVEVDALSNLYVADPIGARLYFVDGLPGGTTYRLAGTGTAGFSGDGGPASQAELSDPRELALDATGTLYVHDAGNRRVRRIAAGLIDSVAGAGLSSSSVAPPLEADLSIRGLAAQGSTELFLSHTTATVGRLSALVPGEPGLVPVLGEGGPAAAGGEAFLEDFGLVTDFVVEGPDRIVWIEDERFVHRVDRRTGRVEHVAGDGNLVASGDGGPAPLAGMNPVAIARGRGGALYLADRLNDRIRRIDPATGIVETVPVTFDPLVLPPPFDRFARPSSVAVDAADNVIVADTLLHRVVRVDAVTFEARVLAGTGSPGDRGDGGPASSAQLEEPRGVFLDTIGNVYVLDQGAYLSNRMRVRRILSVSGRIDTVAGGGSSDPTGIPAVQANLRRLTDGVAAGNVLLLASTMATATGDFDPTLVVRVHLTTGVATRDAGVFDPATGLTADGVLPTELRLLGIHGVGIDANGSIYVTEPARGTLRRYAPTP